ncbi:MAG: hypothetical protein KGI24_09205 [Candidatus Omnitrophica bacterium]|nr:hypothetical protein [Candidatus Omnitrophota bacterium]MDE2215069.1 hypothetical protein [Candidatus Omnitrophota bacterium]
MIKRYGLASAIVFVLMFAAPRVYAQDAPAFNNFVHGLQADRALVEVQLGLDSSWNIYPQATSYYDDMTDHYEQVQLLRDDIDASVFF